jgi:hypothetical protein
MVQTVRVDPVRAFLRRLRRDNAIISTTPPIKSTVAMSRRRSRYNRKIFFPVYICAHVYHMNIRGDLFVIPCRRRLAPLDGPIAGCENKELPEPVAGENDI